MWGGAVSAWTQIFFIVCTYNDKKILKLRTYVSKPLSSWAGAICPWVCPDSWDLALARTCLRAVELDFGPRLPLPAWACARSGLNLLPNNHQLPCFFIGYFFTPSCSVYKDCSRWIPTTLANPKEKVSLAYRDLSSIESCNCILRVSSFFELFLNDKFQNWKEKD